LGVGKLGGPVLVGDDRLVIVKVLEHRKPEPRPLGEVRDGIVTTLTKDEGTQAALAAPQAARGKLAGGASIETVAQELKVAAEPAHFIGRTDPSVPAQVRDPASALPAPGAGKPAFSALTLNTGGAAVVGVSAVRAG